MANNDAKINPQTLEIVTKIALGGVFAEGPPQDPQKVSAW